MTNVYPNTIISYFYPTIYLIMSISYNVHETDPKGRQSKV